MKVQLTYFTSKGKYVTDALYDTARLHIAEVWDEIADLRRMGQLPGLRPNVGRDFITLITVPDHPNNQPHLAMPPIIEDEDVTPIRVVGDWPPRPPRV